MMAKVLRCVLFFSLWLVLYIATSYWTEDIFTLVTLMFPDRELVIATSVTEPFFAPFVGVFALAVACLSAPVNSSINILYGRSFSTWPLFLISCLMSNVLFFFSVFAWSRLFSTIISVKTIVYPSALIAFLIPVFVFLWVTLNKRSKESAR